MSMHDPAHPGESIHELLLKPLNLSVAKAASHIGVSRKTLSKVLNGRGMVTPEMAVRLEKTFGKPSAEHWLKLQSAHDLWQTRQHADEFEVEPVNRNAA